ncbi:hypothetical protein D083_2354 [Dickeya solani RNS 08.23.3.1.A]|nr:hypothetical protein D083_2354 [Dickeya solani RNS 08.23.3.1.A]
MRIEDAGNTLPSLLAAITREEYTRKRPHRAAMQTIPV